MTFTWEMTAADWYKLMKDDEICSSEASHEKMDLCGGYYGCCKIGSLCADIQHTLDSSDCYSYVNIYSQDLKDGYGTTKSGIHYGLLDSNFRVPMNAKSFVEFKEQFERNFRECIKSCNLSKSANLPLTNWD